ncbi:E3 ubiquitin/ISG15 ligase TRIM25-like isoform 2-T2 [Menidia menidia]
MLVRGFQEKNETKWYTHPNHSRLEEKDFLVKEDMATCSSFLSEDQILCSICLDVFTEPVSIPCGHNFCKSCLTQHWANKDQCQCPLCKEKFKKGLQLCINTAFRDVVESFKKHQVTGTSSIKPGQVPCDCCPSNTFPASKTCLVCLTSFCETHLEPHLRVEALKTHKLTNPVHNLEDKICKKHNRILESFCRYDHTRVCDLCTEHTDHQMVYLDEEYVDKKAQLENQTAVFQKTKQIWGKKKRKNARGWKRANQVALNQSPQLYASPDPHHICGYSYIPQNRQTNENGLVLFFDASYAILMLSFVGCKFNETIFFILPGQFENVSWVQRQRRWLWSLCLLCFIVLLFFLLGNLDV